MDPSRRRMGWLIPAPLSSETRSVLFPADSRLTEVGSPRPIAAWWSPTERRPPGTWTGRSTVVPGLISRRSMLPPQWYAGM